MDTTTRQEPSGFLATAFNKVAAKIAVALIFSFSSTQAAVFADTVPPVPKNDTQDTAAPLAALKPSEIPMLSFSPPSAQIAEDSGKEISPAEQIKILRSAGFDIELSKTKSKAHKVNTAQIIQHTREIKSLLGSKSQSQRLTQDEADILRQIAQQAKKYAASVKISKRTAQELEDFVIRNATPQTSEAQIELLQKRKIADYKMESATALALAAHRTGLGAEDMVKQYNGTIGNPSGADPLSVPATNLFKFNAPTWLYLVKTMGAGYGLETFANSIKMHAVANNVAVSVRDPATLRMILSLRDNPRVSAVMGGEYIKNKSQMPLINYAGADGKFDEELKQRQEALIAIGFDLGIRGADGIKGALTDAAFKEYRMIKSPLLPKNTTDDALTAMLLRDATIAADDSARFTTDSMDVTPAKAFSLRHAAQINGDDFGFIMALVAHESSFRNEVEAPTSTASGLFQFVDSTWLLVFKDTAAKYGYGEIAKHIENKGHKNAIENPFIRQYILDLKKSPHVSALMGAEYVKDNYNELRAHMKKITRTDRYVAHFLGSEAAAGFLKHAKKNPQGIAAKAFPAAAKSNSWVFYKEDDGNKKPRTFREIYQYFSKSFGNKNIFDKASDPPPQGPNLRKS